jgi:HEAT repeats
MTRRRRTGLIVIIAVVLVLLVWERWERAREPQYAGRTVSQWFRRYYESSSQDHFDRADYEEASEALKKLGANAVPYLLKQAFDIRADTRFRKVFYGLVRTLPQSWGLPFFVSNQTITTTAAQAICEIKPPAELLLPELEKHLKSNALYERYQAILLLGGLGEGGERGVPYLIAELKGTNSWGQMLAIQSLRFQGLKAKEAVPTLIELLGEQPVGSSGYLRFATTLGHMGSNGAPALPFLEPVFHSTTNWETKWVLAGAISRISPDKTDELNFLINAVNNDPVPQHRSYAVESLIEIGTNSPAVVPALAELVRDPQNEISLRAFYGLKKLGAAKELYVPQFEKALQSTNEKVIADVASQVLWVDPDNRAGLQAMMEFIKRRSVYEGFAIQRLGEIGPAAKEAAPLLREVIATHDKHLREPARKALKRIVAPTNSVSYR